MLYLVLQCLANLPHTVPHLKLRKIEQTIEFPQGAGRF